MPTAGFIPATSGTSIVPGRLLIKGRKKEMIVTPQGLNVFPEDVERALLVQPGVKDAAVVGLRWKVKNAFTRF